MSVVAVGRCRFVGAEEFVAILGSVASNGGIAVALVVIHRMMTAARKTVIEEVDAGQEKRIAALEATIERHQTTITELAEADRIKSEDLAAERAWRYSMEGHIRRLLFSLPAQDMDAELTALVEQINETMRG